MNAYLLFFFEKRQMLLFLLVSVENNLDLAQLIRFLS